MHCDSEENEAKKVVMVLQLISIDLKGHSNGYGGWGISIPSSLTDTLGGTGGSDEFLLFLAFRLFLSPIAVLSSGISRNTVFGPGGC